MTSTMMHIFNKIEKHLEPNLIETAHSDFLSFNSYLVRNSDLKPFKDNVQNIENITRE